MAERYLKSLSSNKVMSESQLADFNKDDPKYKGKSPSEIYDSYLEHYPDEYVSHAPVAGEYTNVKGFSDNFLPSAGNFAMGVLRAPVDIVTAMVPGSKRPPIGDAVSAIGKFAKDRYGSPQAIANTFATDPFGAMADVSAVTGAVGQGASLVSKLRGLGGAAGVARAAGIVSDVTNPLTGPFMAGKAVFRKPLGRMGEKMYSSSVGLAVPGAEDSAQTLQRLDASRAKGIEGEYRPTREDLKRAIDDTSANTKATNDLAKKYSAAGKTVDPHQVGKFINDLIADAGDSITADTENKLMKIRDEFLDRHGKSPMTPEEALAVRRRATREIAKNKAAFGQQLQSPDVEAREAVISGINDQLYAMDPEFKKLGLDSRSLIDLKNSIAHTIISQYSKGSSMGVYAGAQALRAGAGHVSPEGISVWSKYFLTPERKADIALALTKRGFRPNVVKSAMRILNQAGRLDTAASYKGKEPPAAVDLSTPPSEKYNYTEAPSGVY